MDQRLAYVVRVGVLEFRYVSHKHVQPWLIHSYKNIKGRGLVSEPDETEDLVNSLTLKDFPGAPTLPEDRAIRPSLQFTSPPQGDSTVLLLKHQSGGIMMTKKRFAKDGQELPSAKKAKLDRSDQQVIAETSTSQSSGGHSETVTPLTCSHNAVTVVSSVITSSSQTAAATEGGTATSSSVTSPGGRYLLKTITPDQQVVEEKFVDEAELPLTGRKRTAKKMPKKETDLSTALPARTEPQPADSEMATATTAVTGTDVLAPAEKTSSSHHVAASHKDNPLTVQIKTSTDTVVHTSVMSTPQNLSPIVMSPDTRLVPSTSDADAVPSTSSSTAAAADSGYSSHDTLVASASDNTTTRPSRESERKTSACKTDAMPGTVAKSKHSLQMPSGSTSLSGATPSSRNPGYTIQVNLPPMTNIKNIDIKGILKQVQSLINSGVLKVSETKTQVLTVDIGDLKILVSLVPRASKQHHVDGQCTAQATSPASSCSGLLTEQKSPVMVASHSGKDTASSVTQLMASPRTPVRDSGVIPSASFGTPMMASSGTLVRDFSRTSPIRAPPRTPVMSSRGMPSLRASPKTPIMHFSGPPSRTLSVTPVRHSSVIRAQSPLSTITSVVSSTLQPAARQIPRFTSFGSPAAPPSEPASKRKKVSEETLPQLDGTNDTKPEEDKDQNSGSEQNRDKEEDNEGRYVFGHGLGAPPTRGTYQSVRLVCRPWKTPEGTVNRPVLQMMLEGLLAYIMTKPGITWQGLVEKYAPVLQPVPLLELTEMLEVIGCMYKVYLKSSQKPTLFSSRVKIERDDISQSPGSTEFLLLTADCVLKMGQFVSQSQLNKR